ncbi:hypothetical protein MKY25_04885 [Geobacillus sp. FSL W8-0032]|uniref:hypothetical protein n=1 Tax=Geobacillus TaxID=129337 RepID=UPI000B1CECF2|nr:hypothetical protein [Geobacillus icigianus]
MRQERQLEAFFRRACRLAGTRANEAALSIDEPPEEKRRGLVLRFGPARKIGANATAHG